MLGQIRKLGKQTAIYGLVSILSKMLGFVLIPIYTNFIPIGRFWQPCRNGNHHTFYSPQFYILVFFPGISAIFLLRRKRITMELFFLITMPEIWSSTLISDSPFSSSLRGSLNFFIPIMFTNRQPSDCIRNSCCRDIMCRSLSDSSVRRKTCQVYFT